MDYTINFYSHHSGYGEYFSNFSRHQVIMPAPEGFGYPELCIHEDIHKIRMCKVHMLKWKSSEHYYQACKLAYDPELYVKVYHCATPMASKMVGHKYPMIENWECTPDENGRYLKDRVMFDVVLNKVIQNDDILQTLLHTGTSKLAESSPKDYYWGVGADGTGKNMLGIILMEVRDLCKRLFPNK